MEPLTIFSASVGIIGVIHLLSTTADFFAKGKSKQYKTGSRSDWYCFFKMSDLVGQDRQHEDKQGESIQISKDATIYEQRRRQQAQRPRLQV
jgi:hypothetical protein